MAQLKGLRLTATQKQALVLVASASTPKIAADNVSVGDKMILARDSLIKLGFLTLNDNEDKATLTAKGKEFAKSEGLVDDSGELTDSGKKFIPGQTEETKESAYPILLSMLLETESKKAKDAWDHYEYTIASHFMPAIINDDESGLSDKESKQLDKFMKDLPVKGHWSMDDEESHFATDAITGLKSDCVKAKLMFKNRS